jgi:tRNA modification GTPase
MAIEFSVDQPIAALASPPGGGARGIVRISGAHVQRVLSDWFEPDHDVEWKAVRIASSHPGHLILQTADRTLKVAVQVLIWPNRRSYTGQPLIELHLPGSPCLLEAVLSETYRWGARPARPGEFTLRAFLAGKLDLLQAEAVLGVIDAHDQIELQTALAQLAGGVSGPLAQLRRDLLELLADLEAGLDFIEEDIEFVSRDDVVSRLGAARQIVDQLIQQSTERMQSRVRPQVVLAGLPNAGKSTLFNRLAGDNNALVSPEKGTTRDFLCRSVVWNELSFDLIDTAGWEDDSLGIAAAAQQQRAEQLRRADLLVWCTSATLSPVELAHDRQLLSQAIQEASATVRLLTKIDLIECPSPSPEVMDDPKKELVDSPQQIPVSVKTDFGFAELATQLRSHLTRNRESSSQWLGMTAARCRETLASVAVELQRADQAAQAHEVGDELIAVDLRDALDQLGVILGVIYTDDILDRVFSKFCIGK